MHHLTSTIFRQMESSEPHSHMTIFYLLIGIFLGTTTLKIIILVHEFIRVRLDGGLFVTAKTASKLRQESKTLVLAHLDKIYLDMAEQSK